MVPLEELQKLWQSQTVALADADTARAADLTAAFRRYGRRQNHFNVLRLGVVVLQIILWRQAGGPRSLLTWCGMGVLVLGELVFLFSDWRNQLGIARLNFTEPSLEFVRTTIQRLHEQRNPIRRYGWFLGVILAAGLNLLVLAKDQHLAPLERIASHLSASATPFAMYVVGLRIRGMRWNNECLPLVERLRVIERALQESEL
jgi:hypothetical protein